MPHDDVKARRAEYMKQYRIKRAAEGKPLRGPDTRGWRQHKSRAFMRKYGISLEQAEAMWEEQGCTCKVCSRPITMTHGKRTADSAVVDHSHVTGVVRGILCHNCNVALGHMQDDPTLLLKAAAYLAA